MRDIDQYYQSKEEPNRSCLIALRDYILSFDEGIAYEWKYRMPMFTFKKKMLCYIRADQKTDKPYIGLVKGNEIEHPLLIKGSRKKRKVLEVSPNEDLPIEVIKEILGQALKLY